MARLTKAKRDALPDSDFAGPNRTFPIEDAAHRKAAVMLSGYAKDPAAIRAKARTKVALHRRGHPHANLGAYLHKKKG
jgi:hypothetical protein